MAEGKYARYIIDDPKLVRDLAHHDFSAVKGFSYPDPVYMDQELCPEAGAWLDIVWVWDKTVPAELPGLHRHAFPEIVLLVGSNPHDLRDLGGEVSWGMGEGDDAETYRLTHTTAIYVPPGLAHAPLVYERVDRPILNIVIGLNTGGYA
jgi:hypothetical protein